MRVCIQSFGCAANQAEAEIMAGLLSAAHFEIVEEPNKADIIIINSCIVKTPTEGKLVFRLAELSKKYPDKAMVVTGCAPEVIAERIKSVVPDASLVSTHHIGEIVKAVTAASKGKRMELIGETDDVKLGFPRIRKNPAIAIVQIASGCVGDCTYCATRLAKGKLVSYQKNKILDEVRTSVKDGCKEIWLTAEDTAVYGIDKGQKLPELMKDISKIDGDFYVRLGMANPSSIKPILTEVIKAMNSPKFYKFLHIPVQSGSDEILKAMNRRYSAKDFADIVEELRNAYRCQIWTDIIVGYPGETSEQFRKTLDLLKRTEPDYANVSKFGARAGTEAAELDQLPADIMKERAKQATQLVTELALKANKKWIGWEGEVLISNKGTKTGSWIGRNFAYKACFINKRGNLLGKKLKVKILDASATGLVAWPIKE